MNAVDVRTATHVLIDWPTGEQTKLSREDTIIGYANGGPPMPVEIEQVPDILAAPDGWVQWASEAVNGATEDVEWEREDHECPCVSRVYARGIHHVMLIWADA